MAIGTDTMGGNDTHDKYGRPYELDDGVEKLYDKLEESREENYLLRYKLQEFKEYLEKEMEECSPSMGIEFSQTNEILGKFLEFFDFM